MSKGEQDTCGMSLIVKTIVLWLQGIMLVFAGYVVLSGHLTPGGGFAGGVIVACVFILRVLSHGKEAGNQRLGRSRAAFLAGIGTLVFLGAALTGLLARNVFLKNLSSNSGHAHSGLLGASFILVCEIAIAMIVGASLFLVFSVLSGMRVKIRLDGEECDAESGSA